MENDKIWAIFSKVKDLTMQGKLIWNEEADLNSFFASVDEYKIHVGKSAGTITFELFNHLYEKIGMLEHGGYSADAEGLDLFYAYVRKTIQNNDDGLDDLLERLDSID